MLNHIVSPRKTYLPGVVTPLLAILLSILVTNSTSAAGLILNEYSAVSSENFLNGGDSLADDDGELSGDATFGRIPGNGGDWFELVVTLDEIDFRGWSLELWVEGELDTTLTLSQNSIWTEMRAGTIIAISEDQPEDASYEPSSGDWSVVLRADSDAAGTYITASSFPVNNDDWQIIIKDAAGVIQYGPAGEGVGPGGGVNSREIFKLEEDPSDFISESSACFDDSDSYSTFGKPNVWSGGTKVQNFEALRTGSPPTSQCDDTDLSDLAFDPNHLLEIEITIDPEDYEVLRRQQRTLMSAFGGRCGDAPAPSPYTYFEADVSIDGVNFVNVGLRKKGFFGSISRSKPSFKIDLTEYGEESKFFGQDRITLNNLQQDPSRLDQCLSYGLYADAGLKASRCSFAHVTVNGVSFGIYSNVESIKAPFLVRNYGDASGKLYEGSVADFRENWIGIIEKKNNDDATDLVAIKNAIEIQDDESALEAMGALIDLDLFIRGWALDFLIQNWDGYSGNANNWWMYENPSSGKYEFLPWSLDDNFGRDNPFLEANSQTRVVFDNSAISNRLWRIESIRELYEAALNDLLVEIWDESALLAEIDRMEALIFPVTGDLSGPIDATRSFISGRASTIQSIFANGAPESGTVLADKLCLEIEGSLEASFETSYSDPIPDGPAPGSTLSVDSFNFSGETSLEGIGSAFGPFEDAGFDMLTLRPIGLSNGSLIWAFSVAVNKSEIAPAMIEPIALGDSISSFIVNVALGGSDLFFRGFVVNANLQFNQADLTPGGAVTGSLSAELATWVPHPVPEPGAVLSMTAVLFSVAVLARSRRR